jgi:branched-chain amino acid transport system permease protein
VPIAIAGGLGIALLQSYALGYLPSTGFLAKFQNDNSIIPIVVLFLVLVFLPQDELKRASAAVIVAPRTASLRASILWGAVLVAGAVIISHQLSVTNLQIGATGFALGLVLLSMVLMTGYGGMVSLCQMTFVGLGSLAMGHLGHGGSLLGVVAAVGLAAGVGALVAIPTLRLKPLYLALATFAFATVLDTALFTQVFGTGSDLAVARVHVPGIPTSSGQAFFVLTAVVFAVAAVGVLALRRSRYGRRLVASNDSAAACATLGVSVTVTRLVVFTTAAGMAGLAGALYGGAATVVNGPDFNSLVSLVLLLLVIIGGVNTASGALFGAFTFVLYPVLQQHASWLPDQYLLTGAAAFFVGLNPNGACGLAALLVQRRRQVAATELAALPAQSPAAVFFQEEGSLVH